jgi:hypothetical protein
MIMMKYSTRRCEQCVVLDGIPLRSIPASDLGRSAEAGKMGELKWN